MNKELQFSSKLGGALLKEIVPKGGRAEIAAAGIVIAIVIAMILPLPIWLLDFLLAVNICLATLMVIVVVQIKDSVGLSSFPSILLITTLFRVALSIASTRMILLEGTAGHIIEAFGEVVVGGNLVVGVVIFLILTVVQFIVITKGSERVAEVGARFTLDAMPGKQLAIDIELKSGSITAEDAREKRAILGQESQFFGAMDGAMKFVKGDAIASIIIALTNLIGGITIGVLQRGMGAADAARVYSILSIGDALVAQVPALLFSLTAGLLITRVANGMDGPRNVGNEIAAQLIAQPKAWVIASGAMIAFGLLPGMPLLIFAFLSLGSLSFGLNMFRKKIGLAQSANGENSEEVKDIREFSTIRPFLIRLSSNYTNAQSATNIINVVKNTRNKLVISHGYVTPEIVTEYSDTLVDCHVEFCQDEVAVFSTYVYENLYTAICPLPKLEQLNIVPAVVDNNELGGTRIWVAEEDSKRLLDELGIISQHFYEYLSSRVNDALWKFGVRYVGFDQAQKIFKWIEAQSPDLAKELERTIPVGRMVEVLQKLLSERVSIRNLSLICSILVEWGGRERDAAVLAECVRREMHREIVNVYAIQKELKGFLLHVDVESIFRGAIRQTAYGDFLDLDYEIIENILDKFSLMLHPHLNKYAVVILAHQDIRPHVRKLFKDRFPEVAVIGLTEVPSDYKVKILGSIDYGDE